MAGKTIFQSFIEAVPKPLRNKYFLAIIFFVAWLIFFDSHDIITQYRLQRTVNKLEKDREFYENKIEEVKQQEEEIREDPEKIAREKYFMKKKDEDVFIIEKKNQN